MAITDAVRGSEGLTRTERRHERPRLVAARLGMLDESGQLGPASCLLVGQVRPPLSSPAASELAGRLADAEADRREAATLHRQAREAQQADQRALNNLLESAVAQRLFHGLDPAACPRCESPVDGGGESAKQLTICALSAPHRLPLTSMMRAMRSPPSWSRPWQRLAPQKRRRSVV